MGNYLNFTREEKSLKVLTEKLRAVYNTHKSKNKEQFKNEFGKINRFNEVFFIFNTGNDGSIKIERKEWVQIKTGVLDKDFYTEEFLEDVKKVLADFGFSL